MRIRCIFQIKPIVALLLIFAMLLPFSGCKKEKSTVSDTTMVVTSADDAIAQLANSAASYGYENALSELTERSSSTIDGDHYYRLQQNYQGIPVYGKTVVCATDKEGNVTSLTGNLTDVFETISLTPMATVDQITLSIREYLSKEKSLENVNNSIIDNLDKNDLCIYIDHNDTINLAYRIRTEGYELVVDANTGSILSSISLIATHSNATILDELNIAYTTSPDGDIWLHDTTRNIYVHELNSTEDLTKEIEALLSDENMYYMVKPESGATSGVYAMANTIKTYDYFRKLGRTGYDNNNSACYILMCSPEILCDQAKANTAEQAAYLFIGAPTNLFTFPIGKALDIIAHEYTHLITQNEVNFIDGTEQIAISEAISDILGNTIESFYRGRVDTKWELGEDAGYSKYAMKDVATMTQFDSSDSSGHVNARIISHAAYLMWNGINNTESKRISTDDLAKLWYRAMLMMPSDCNFNECRKLVELAATSMKLTTEQIQCVSEAFDAVGITGTAKESFVALYDLAPDSTLSVYGGDSGLGDGEFGERKLYDNYTLHITGNTTIYGPVIEKVDSSYTRTRIITTAEPHKLDLPHGIYLFTISDNVNPSNTKSFTVCIQNDEGDSNLDIFTYFGCTPVKGTVSEIKTEAGKEINSPVTDAITTLYYGPENTIVQTINMADTEGFFELYLPVGNYSFVTEAEGYNSSTVVLEITSYEATYLNIILESAFRNQADWAAAYIPKVEQALVTTSQTYSGGWTSATLFDLDNDQIPELILSYPWWQGGSSHISVYAYDVYDYQDDQLICYAEKQTYHAAYVAGSEGYVGLELFDNKPALITYYRWGETDSGEGYSNAEYGLTIFDSTDFIPIRTLWVDAEGYDAVYKINDIEVSEEEFANELTRYSCISMSEYPTSPVYFRATDNYSIDLYDMLCQLQSFARISPTELPKLTNEEAKEIATSLWQEYFDQPQEDKFRISTGNSIIKNGIVYYVIALERNPSYSEEDDWHTYRQLFIDSVTGKTNYTLY